MKVLNAPVWAFVLLTIIVEGALHIPKGLIEASTYEEVLEVVKESEEENETNRLRGRRRLQDGSFEVSRPLLAASFGGEPGFYHSVASGDPLPNAVIIWTRYTPVDERDEITLEFRMAPIDPKIPFENHLNPSKNPELRRGTVIVTSSTDWIAKIDVMGLASNTKYVYAFTYGQRVSDVGQTKTAPAENESVSDLRYAFFSCSHLNNGYFHSYDLASTITDIDVWFHIGDFIYEYGSYNSYANNANATRGPLIMPPWEIVSLQDYRLRYASYIQSDEGLRNLRRNVPFAGSWDDHEMANNAWGNRTAAGAENHQPVCTVGPNATADQRTAANCDQNEGDAIVRFTHAIQAYLEWLPHRYVPDISGAIKIGMFPQVMQWGDLATFVSLDTRISYRSEEPTVNSDRVSTLVRFAGFTTTYPNVTDYTNPSTPAYAALQQLVAQEKALRLNPAIGEIGDNIRVLQEAFAASKSAGKPWQIWAANTGIGPNVLPDLNTLHQFVPNAAASATVMQYTNAVLASSPVLRAVTALAVNHIETNRDDFGGFWSERIAVINTIAANSNNPVILTGDLHDSLAWILYGGGDIYRGGNITGNPVAVAIGGPGVTSPGLGPVVIPIFDRISAAFGGQQGIYNVVNARYRAQDYGLVYNDFQYKGFVAVHTTKKSHTSEYFLFQPNITLTDYPAARTISGGITAPYLCGTQLVTTAGQPGSLIKNPSCSAIRFDTVRPAVWSLPVPYVPNPNVNAGSELTECGYMGCQFACQTFTLVTTSSKQVSDIRPLLKKGLIRISSNEYRALNVRYNACAKQIGSVKFYLDGAEYSIDNNAPFYLTRKTWTPRRGTHTLLAQVYSNRKGLGELVESAQVTFTVAR